MNTRVRRRPRRPGFSCSRPETIVFSQIFAYQAHERKLGRPRLLQGREQGNQRFRTARTLTSQGDLLHNQISASNLTSL